MRPLQTRSQELVLSLSEHLSITFQEPPFHQCPEGRLHVPDTETHDGTDRLKSNSRLASHTKIYNKHDKLVVKDINKVLLPQSLDTKRGYEKLPVKDIRNLTFKSYNFVFSDHVCSWQTNSSYDQCLLLARSSVPILILYGLKKYPDVAVLGHPAAEAYK